MLDRADTRQVTEINVQRSASVFAFIINENSVEHMYALVIMESNAETIERSWAVIAINNRGKVC